MNNLTIAPAINENPIIKEKTSFIEERQVTLHCYLKVEEGQRMRIWKTTYLFCRQNKIYIPMIHCEGISIFPEWTTFNKTRMIHFTLYFSKLPDDCVSFDLMEKIPELGGFFSFNIIRRKDDVYIVKIFSTDNSEV